jgi:hypothetical protein
MTRREAVRWLALGVAGMSAGVLGVSALLNGPPARAMDVASLPERGEPAMAPAALGGLVPAGQLPGPTVQVFKSRPDLRPPAITIDVPAGPQVSPGLIITDCHFGPGQQGPIIFDHNGNLVWFVGLSADCDPSLRAFNVRVQSYGGQPVLTWFRGAVVDVHGEGHYEIYDPTYRVIAQVYAGNGYHGDLHDFVLTERGTALLTCYGTATADLSSFGGATDGSYFYGVVQEVDVATGQVLFQWRSDQHVEFEDSYVALRPDSPWDYFHINAICVDPTDQNLIISSRNTWAFYKVDRTTGAVLWRVGGKASDFTVAPDAAFAFQHDVHRWPDGSITLFDNEAGPPIEASQSRGLVLALDEQARTATLLAQYEHAPPVLSKHLGSVQDLGSNGYGRFTGWGTSSYFTEYDAAGNAVFDGRLAPGTESYRAFKQEWHGMPAEPPALAAEPGPGGVAVYASWNGATEVASWCVLAGPQAGQLSAVASAPRSGFETVLTVQGSPAVVMVEALDCSGRVLAQSAVTPVPYQPLVGRRRPGARTQRI